MNKFLFLSLLCLSISTTWDPYLISQVWDDMVNNIEQNKLRRYMIFEVNPDEVNDVDYFGRIITDFFLSNNIKSGLVNIKNKILIAYLSKEDDIKIKHIREYFGNAFRKIYWFDKKKKEHDFRNI